MTSGITGEEGREEGTGGEEGGGGEKREQERRRSPTKHREKKNHSACAGPLWGPGPGPLGSAGAPGRAATGAGRWR